MSYLLILIGLVVLIFGGNTLVQGASGIAKRLKLSPLVIGMTVVAFGTSAPELMVSLKAAYLGSPEIALGNVIGSNIANISLVLGIIVLILPLPIDKNSRNIDWPVMFAASIIFFGFALNGNISRAEGIFMFIALSVFTYLLIRNSRKKTKKREQIQVSDEPIPQLWKSVLLNLAGLAMLYFGAQWLLMGAIDLAEEFGLEERIIGVTIIAIGTSIPELAASIIAAARKETDISLGNLVGSNIFNILSVIGLTAAIKPIEVSQKIINPDMLWMLGIAIIVGVILFFWKKIKRWHGLVLLASYATYITILILSVN